MTKHNLFRCQAGHNALPKPMIDTRKDDRMSFLWDRFNIKISDSVLPIKKFPCVYKTIIRLTYFYHGIGKTSLYRIINLNIHIETTNGPQWVELTRSPILTHLPSVAYMRRWTGSALVQIMACRLCGAKPLPGPTVAYCQLNPSEQTSVKFVLKTTVLIHEITFETVVCEMAAILSRREMS